MWAWYGLGVLLFLLLVYLFLVFPGNGKRASAFARRYIAHRGLHGDGILENTLPAFVAAVNLGYGVELDIRLSSDGIPVVAHDEDLKRVFGDERRVSALSAEELAGLGVPRLQEVLSVLDGRVPLVAEIKGESFDTEVCERAAAVLDGYDGLYCVESFNPMHLRWFKKHRKQVIRGQLSTAFGKKRDGKRNTLHLVLRHLLLNAFSRPHFIAYEHRYYGVSVRICRALGALTVCWTPQSAAEVKAASRHYDSFIFEGFLP